MLLAVAAVGFVLRPGLSRAQVAPPPAERQHDYSAYEAQTIARVVGERGLKQDPAPEGKIVERVEIVPIDVFEERDILPQWLNVFHMTTRRRIIAHEVLLKPGDRYQQAVVDDTIRNLRRLPGVPQLSAVLVVAAEGSAADRVVLVVITKDVWSLRLNWDVIADPGGLDELDLQPSETNFLGTHQIVGATFILQPATYTIGAHYTIPGIGESRIATNASADVVVNLQTGRTEGSYGSLVAGEPLYSGSTDWSWDARVSWQDVFLRRYVNAQLSTFSDTSTGEKLPFVYHSRQAAAVYELTRSFGWDVNHDLTVAAGFDRGVYQIPSPTGPVSARTMQDFSKSYVPVSDTRAGPSLQYHTYEMRFLRTIDFDTLALQEDYRLGHDIVLRIYPSFRALGSSRDVLGLYGALQYTWAVRDGLFRAALQTTTEPERERIADASIQPTAHLVTPTVAGLGRIVVDGTLLYRYRNYLNQTSTLGGSDRLRGYPTNFFVGNSVMSYNVELRSRPVEILSMELGGVAFYDVGSTFAQLDHAVPYQSVGVGVRTLFPWLDRTVFQADLAFPVERPLDPSTGALIPSYSFIISFGQAFATPTVAPLPVLPTGQGPDSP